MNRLSCFLKTSHVFYFLYFIFFSSLFKLLGVFIKTHPKMILFNSFGGQKYDDSPKTISDLMLSDSRFDDCNMVWAFQNPDNYKLSKRISVIRCDTPKYFITALRAGIWVTNSSMERGLSFKKKSTFCLNTWHGSAIKKMGIDIPSTSKSFHKFGKFRNEIMLAQSKYDIDIFSHAFCMDQQSFCCTGLPRNDCLCQINPKIVSELKRKLGIPLNKIVLLYAPTYREYSKNQKDEVVLDIPISLQKWQNLLGADYLILFRAHYEVAKHMNLAGFPLFSDYSLYPELNDLMMVSDGLISDFSSIFFDYSIMHKPMYGFAYDFDEYLKERGSYLDFDTDIPWHVHKEEDSLLQEILCFNNNYQQKQQESVIFQRRFVQFYGHATDECCDIIYKHMKEK